MGNRSRSARTVSIVSSTVSVVCDSHTTFSGSRTVTDAASAAVSTSWMCDGASPEVPSTSSWPACPTSRMSKSSRAYRLASWCTLVTSGHVASIVRRFRSRASRAHRGRHAVRREHQQRTLGHLVGVVDEDRAALLERLDDVPVVDDLLAHVDGGAVLLEGLLDGLDGAVDARAVAAGLGQQDAFAGRIAAAGHDLRSGHTSRVRAAAGAPGTTSPDPGCRADGERG